ncbi:MAG: hypothetical protein J0H49_36210 [Acidobacteria bacterium]|nr:hypothetical protein [Acidobacteriota bacterium]
MAEWNYEIRMIHLDENGVVKLDVPVGGPHDLNFAPLKGSLEAKLVDLEPLPNDPTKLRLKLTFQDKP